MMKAVYKVVCSEFAYGRQLMMIIKNEDEHSKAYEAPPVRGILPAILQTPLYRNKSLGIPGFSLTDRFFKTFILKFREIKPNFATPIESS
jgi:hypothetical protein